MTQQHIPLDRPTMVEVSRPITGQPLVIGNGFSAQSFKHAQFNGLMDPLVLVDHFVMTEPTFGAHPHAGMSAVSVLFEDSEGLFHNRDSLGNDFDIAPGDLYWLKAGRGAVHDEAPVPGARIHALQVFVNLPSEHKADAPSCLHVPATEMPILDGEGFRTRIVLGQSSGVQGATSPALPLTILDIKLAENGSFTHESGPEQTSWILAVRGDAIVKVDQTEMTVRPGTAVALRSSTHTDYFALYSRGGAHLAMLQGDPVNEPFVQKGPFVMDSMAEIDAVDAAYKAGKLGSIEPADR